ncbi:hypothetical protein CLOSTMETH_02976 [[Clostridium] methylpentosum DSM 5476]|uniref:Uncharacterized protein n=1 Tax=[Clostridium] methylpentosum DSM 5476 TaxID=537013 RepID=C0EGI3_9FIRM|nr:hypothetical protein CLOSTMETH_02976 [[Clostridium] methylpentosum DSM 5476]
MIGLDFTKIRFHIPGDFTQNRYNRVIQLSCIRSLIEKRRKK